MTLREEYERFVEDPNLTRQARGIRFEKFIGTICRREQLRYRRPYRPRGEQIDGAVEVGGRTYLLEAKYEDVRTSASKVYAFRGKIEGKLSGTLGIFWSVSGYSEECLEAVRIGKELNVILFDESDLQAILDGAITFTDLLQEKRWIAVTAGVLYHPWSTIETLRVQQEPSTGVPLLIFVEGKRDVEIIKSLVNHVLPNLPNEDFNILLTHGRSNMMNTLQVIASQISDYSTEGVLAVLDRDCLTGNEVRMLRREFYSVLESLGVRERFHFAIADPDVFGWVGMSTANEHPVRLDVFDWANAIDSDTDIGSLSQFLLDRIGSRR